MGLEAHSRSEQREGFRLRSRVHVISLVSHWGLCTRETRSRCSSERCSRTAVAVGTAVVVVVVVLVVVVVVAGRNTPATLGVVVFV
jgi:hypothetical protein